MPTAPFPPEKDLPADAVSCATWLTPQKTPDDVARITSGLRQQYAAIAAERGQPLDCDLIVMAVPAGRGRTFAEGLQEALAANRQLLQAHPDLELGLIADTPPAP